MALSPRDEQAIQHLIEVAPLPTIEQRDKLARLLRLHERTAGGESES
jgi:hypothetical protein